MAVALGNYFGEPYDHQPTRTTPSPLRAFASRIERRTQQPTQQNRH
jgi:hypothetical protein